MGELNDITDLINGIMAIVATVFVYNSRRKNQTMRIRAKRAGIIELYDIFLGSAMFSVLIQLGAKNKNMFLECTNIIISFIIPIIFTLLIMVEIWKYYGRESFYKGKVLSCEGWVTCIINFFIAILYCGFHIYILYLSYLDIFKNDIGWEEYIRIAFTLYVSLIFMHIVISRLLIGTHTKLHATKVTIVDRLHLTGQIF